jgi:hypothetical protein
MFLLARISNSLIRACFCLQSCRGIGGDDAVTSLGRRNWSLQIGCCWAGIHSSGIEVQSAADAVKIIKQAMEVRLGRPQALIFLDRAVKGTKLKTEAMELWGKLAATIKPCSNQSFTKNKRSPILRGKQLQCGTRGDQPTSYSGQEYSRLF